MKSLSILLVMAIAAAQLLCSCQFALAVVLEPIPLAGDIHACCETTPAPAKPVDHACPHCNGTVTNGAIAQTNSPAVVPGHTFLALAMPATFELFQIRSNRLPVSQFRAISPPPLTLLSQHCALLV